jgi:uncharacterized membrane protein YcfT
MVNIAAKSRVDWVDCAKGICIILVVMMHSTLGVEKQAGAVSWVSSFIEWARPFRMPDFFLISGLFLAARIDRPWRSFLDSKVLHFAYFYLLWMTIQLAIKGPSAEGWLMGLIEPFGTLWFIYLLAVFCVAAKLLRQVNPWIVFGAAALLEAAPIETGWLLPDEFAARFVYFYAGFWLSKHVFSYAAGVASRDVPVIASGLLIWGMANHLAVASGLAFLPGASLLAGCAGVGGVIAFAVLLAKLNLDAVLKYCGSNSLVIYLAFFLFMAGTRSALFRFSPGLDLGVMALSVTAAGVIGPLVLHQIIKHTPLRFLFERPQALRLSSPKAGWHSAAHGHIATS